MPELVILGSGTSNGVPMLGYDYPPGYLDNPKNHRTRSSVVFRGPEGNLLVDCSPEMRLQMVREGIRRVEGVIITHTHADHIMGMDDLRSLCILTGEPIRIYTFPEHMPEIRRVFPYAFKEFPKEIMVPRFDMLEAKDPLSIAGMEVQCFPVSHGSVRVVGIRVDKLAYITDVSEIPPEAEHYLDGLDTLVIDAVRLKPHPNHLTFDQAIAVAQRFRPRQTYFTHLSHDYDHDVTEASMPGNIRLAYDGLRVAF